MRTRRTCRRLAGQLLQRQQQKQPQKPRRDQPQKQQQLLVVPALLPAPLLLVRLALLLAVRSVRLRWLLHTVWVSSFLLLALRQGCASYPQRWTLHDKLLMRS
jgi:hypothetical protein